MPTFLRAYGDTVDANGNPQLTSGTLSLLSSIVQVGELVGSLSAAIIGGYLGRRGGLVAACIFVTLGSIIQLATNGSIGGMTGGRLV